VKLADEVIVHDTYFSINPPLWRILLLLAAVAAVLILWLGRRGGN
jgi:hypothetical protein